MPLFWIFGLLCLSITMIIYPQEIFSSSLYGLKIWWEIVFPSLLPFFIIADLMMNLGAVKIIGKLVEPLMRPLFNLPGESALAVAIGYTSGYPIGAVLTAKLRSENIITRNEAERLLAFTNNASPLFMFVAIPIGMLGLPDAGIIIASSHYIANILIGLIYRFYGREERKPFLASAYAIEVKAAFNNLLSKKTKPIGSLLGDAVKNAMQSLTSIGGYIIFFSVLLKSLQMLGIIAALEKMLMLILPKSLPLQLHSALANGFIEMTIGSKTAGDALANLQTKLIIISIVLAWSGLSIHAQVLSQISSTDIRYLPFLVARIIHAALAAVLCKIFMVSHVFNVAKYVSFYPFITNTAVLYYEWRVFGYIVASLLIINFITGFIKRIFKY